MPSQASTRFTENKKDIEMLWHIHTEVAGPGKGRKHRVDVLNRSAIVFISACWESYIEDVAVEAFDFLLSKADTPDLIPAKVRTIASRELREAKDERRIWELAGSGWQKVLENHRNMVRETWLKDFNTPKSRQVSDLFSGLIGLSDITASWTWNAMSAEQARQKLDQYITIRGNIAHRIKHDETVYKNWGKGFLLHVVRLVEKSDEIINNHLHSLIAVAPW
jgi:RiboL-PSP-HEPN